MKEDEEKIKERRTEMKEESERNRRVRGRR